MDGSHRVVVWLYGLLNANQRHPRGSSWRQRNTVTLSAARDFPQYDDGALAHWVEFPISHSRGTIACSQPSRYDEAVDVHRLLLHAWVSEELPSVDSAQGRQPQRATSVPDVSWPQGHGDRASPSLWCCP
jgi:hypothetical protein